MTVDVFCVYFTTKPELKVQLGSSQATLGEETPTVNQPFSQPGCFFATNSVYTLSLLDYSTQVYYWSKVLLLLDTHI